MKRLILTTIALVIVIVNGHSQSLVIQHCGFTLSYNCDHLTANWVSWTLTKSHVLKATVERSSTFYPDPSVPSRYRVTSDDYTNSGYDRGHLCPAADMYWSPQSMHDCFLMTNICPQNPQLNRISWKQLETACRKWVLTEDTLYIVAGPVYLDSNHSSIIVNRLSIMVPTGFYKVILSLRKGHAKAIGFYYLNTTQKQSLQSTCTTVDAIENLTGIDFFQWFDDTIESQLESHYRLQDWK